MEKMEVLNCWQSWFPAFFSSLGFSPLFIKLLFMDKFLILTIKFLVVFNFWCLFFKPKPEWSFLFSMHPSHQSWFRWTWIFRLYSTQDITLNSWIVQEYICLMHHRLRGAWSINLSVLTVVTGWRLCLNLVFGDKRALDLWWHDLWFMLFHFIWLRLYWHIIHLILYSDISF